LGSLEATHQPNRAGISLKIRKNSKIPTFFYLTFSNGIVNIIRMSVIFAKIAKNLQIPTQKMPTAFFATDRQQATGNRQQATGNYTHLLTNRVNYPIEGFAIRYPNSSITKKSCLKIGRLSHLRDRLDLTLEEDYALFFK